MSKKRRFMDQGFGLKALPDLLAASISGRTTEGKSAHREGAEEDFLTVLGSAIEEPPSDHPELSDGGFGLRESVENGFPLADTGILEKPRAEEAVRTPVSDTIGKYFPGGLHAETATSWTAESVPISTKGREHPPEAGLQKPLESGRRAHPPEAGLQKPLESGRRAHPPEADLQKPLESGRRAHPPEADLQKPLVSGQRAMHSLEPLMEGEDYREGVHVQDVSASVVPAASQRANGHPVATDVATDVAEKSRGASYEEPTVIQREPSEGIRSQGRASIRQKIRHYAPEGLRIPGAGREQGPVAANLERYSLQESRAKVMSLSPGFERQRHETPYKRALGAGIPGAAAYRAAVSDTGNATLPAKDIRSSLNRPNNVRKTDNNIPLADLKIGSLPREMQEGVAVHKFVQKDFVRQMPEGQPLPRTRGYGSLSNIREFEPVGTAFRGAVPSPVDTGFDDTLGGIVLANSGRAEPAGLSLSMPAPDALDVQVDGSVRSEDTIRRIVEYVEANRPSLVRRLDVVVEHDNLGRFGLRAVKGGADQIDVSITTQTPKGQSFFEDNRAELAKALSLVGVRLMEVKVLGNGEAPARFESSFEGRDNETAFSSSRDGRDGEEADSRRRRNLWEEYRERFGGGAGA